MGRLAQDDYIITFGYSLNICLGLFATVFELKFTSEKILLKGSEIIRIAQIVDKYDDGNVSFIEILKEYKS
jgi:hypothetical protein